MKTVLILGASRYYRRYFEVARELGFRVVAADRNPSAECFPLADVAGAVDIVDIPGCLALARRTRVHGVVAVNDFGVPTAAAVAAALGLPGISPEAARYATSKAWMRRLWEATGVPSARFRVAATLAEAQAAAKELGMWPLVVKPADSRGGASRGVSIVDCPAALPEAVRLAQSFYADQTIVLEEFLAGTEHSMETLTVDGHTHVVAISDKVKTPPPYRVDKSVIYPTLHDGPTRARMCDAAARAIAALGITDGAAHVEMCVTADGPRLFELGPRLGGGHSADPIARYVSGVPLMHAVFLQALGERLPDLRPNAERGCVYRFLTPPPGTVSEVLGLDEVRAWSGILDVGVTLRPGDEIRSVRSGPDRAGFIVAGAWTRGEALALADRAEAAIRFHCGAAVSAPVARA